MKFLDHIKQMDGLIEERRRLEHEKVLFSLDESAAGGLGARSSTSVYFDSKGRSHMTTKITNGNMTTYIRNGRYTGTRVRMT